MMNNHPDRRTAIRHGLAATAALFATPSALYAALRESNPGASERPWLAAAMKAENWLALVAQRSDRGIAWPADPIRPRVTTDLYTGMAGVVLFYLELHHATGDERALQMARGGADYLASAVPDESANATAGLYTGMAGTAVVLFHAYRATGDERYATAMRRALAHIAASAKAVGSGVEWNESTDIISGSAGIGLALLALADQAQEFDARQLAAKAGDRLLERAQKTAEGLSWLISPEMPRNYPNFSHGTAGVSFFLARLSRTSGKEAHLNAALAGEKWLQSITTTSPNGARKIYHSAPGNEELFYLSWCHGPAGTARLYRELADVTGDARWEGRVGQLATATRDMKVPERSPGFWNNVSQCCGNCGVTEFFVALHRRERKPQHLAFADDVAHDTLRRGTAEGDGMKWIQAEHRVRPELLVAQTGLMQGAAGIGLALLHLDGAHEGRKPLVRLPDDPF
jgi:lantibiotic modifying enzyme